jgi:hypothetical protein
MGAIRWNEAPRLQDVRVVMKSGSAALFVFGSRSLILFGNVPKNSPNYVHLVINPQQTTA